MRDIIIEHAQPYLTTIVTALIGLLATLIITGIRSLKLKLDTWLDTRVSVGQRELLHQIAKEAFAHAETIYKYSDGEQKLHQALTYATERLGKIGIHMTTNEIKAAIHDAWLCNQPEPPRLD